MITIDARTKEVRGWREHEPQMYSDWKPGLNTTPGYIRGWTKPNFPMPAIPMQIERRSDGWPVLVEMYRTDSGSSSVTIMHIGSASDLYNW